MSLVLLSLSLSAFLCTIYLTFSLGLRDRVEDRYEKHYMKTSMRAVLTQRGREVWSDPSTEHDRISYTTFTIHGQGSSPERPPEHTKVREKSLLR